jgi:hypothetical protein
MISVPRISLQILIIVWWVGAAAVGVAILLPSYSEYAIIGSIGWIIVCASTTLVMYEIRRIRAEDREKKRASESLG